jgi:hypothetical protein
VQQACFAGVRLAPHLRWRAISRPAGFAVSGRFAASVVLRNPQRCRRLSWARELRGARAMSAWWTPLQETAGQWSEHKDARLTSDCTSKS